MIVIYRIPQMILGFALCFAGIGHLGANRLEFQAQVPNLLKEYADFVVLASGVVEIMLGVGLLVLWKFRVPIGFLTAAFFVAIFWGNISQFLNQTDAFGLNSDQARFVRLLFQPLLVAWALLSTGAFQQWRKRKKLVL